MKNDAMKRLTFTIQILMAQPSLLLPAYLFQTFLGSQKRNHNLCFLPMGPSLLWLRISEECLFGISEAKSL